MFDKLSELGVSLKSSAVSSKHDASLTSDLQPSVQGAGDRHTLALTCSRPSRVREIVTLLPLPAAVRPRCGGSSHSCPHLQPSVPGCGGSSHSCPYLQPSVQGAGDRHTLARMGAVRSDGGDQRVQLVSLLLWIEEWAITVNCPRTQITCTLENLCCSTQCLCGCSLQSYAVNFRTSCRYHCRSKSVQDQ